MKSSMAAAGSEQQELLVLVHQYLVQIGYQKAAKELLRQSGQVTASFPTWVGRDRGSGIAGPGL